MGGQGLWTLEVVAFFLISTEPSGPIVFKSIEHEILSKFYSLGKQHFEAAEYPNAEQFLCRFLSMDSASPDGDHSRRSEAREMLATSLIKQRKLIEAERVLLACIGDAPEKDLRAIRSTYSLAEIYLETGQSDKAEIYCKRSLKEADEVFGRTHPLVNQSGELLMEIYRNTGDLVALQACSSTIFPSRIVSGGFRWNKAVSLLKDNGFSLEGMDQERKSNALRWAAEKGLENVVLVLLETKDGIKNIVDLKDRIGKTALHYAAAYGHASIAKLLLQNSADVEIRAACSMRALHLAAHYAEVEVVRVLLDHGAEIESRTNDGKTVLHHAVERNSLTIIQLMISRQANIEARDLKQRTPIFWGCKNDRMDAIKLLLLNGANFMAKDVEGNTALHWAAWYGQVSMVKLFVEHGADLSAKGVNDENPLGLAVSNGHARAVMILLDYGAPTELKNSFGRTALHFAAKKGNLDIVCLLVRVGANILACDNTGKTVLDVARDNRQKAVSTYLSAKVETRR
jgi:ankyrin repeat protein